ncbi:hypothetical protein niasHT_000832 [Heterodera trifolii]|uniref:B30.2/SPRY domain-containing protein n=1 Tax=Heterodera trifolii TaxID=157864 RepID=A0ABD2MAL3_9BILA
MRENQNALAEKMSGIEAKLEKLIENGKCENQNGLTAKIENGMPENQKAPSLMKNMATPTRNATGERFPDFCSCRAGPIQMPSSDGRIGIIYTEYRILNNGLIIIIGLSTKEMPLNKLVGNGRVSYGYSDIGKIESTNANGNYANILDNVPYFGTGNVVGCGLNLATRQLFFTKNGQRLNITNLYVDEGTADLYPTVSLYDHGNAVEANFGPNFEYDLSKEF